jgi:hypothetical protein
MASISGANTIVLKGKYSEGGAEHEEGRLKAAASPGMNVTTTNDFDELGRQVYTPGATDYAGTGTDVSTTKAPIWILKEDTTTGKTVDDAYAADDNGLIHMASPGEVLQVLVASGQTVAKGGGLTANSAGKWVSDATNAAVIALESSGGALGADTLMRVRVL